MSRRRSWPLVAIAFLLLASAFETDARNRRDRGIDIPLVLFTTLPQVDPAYPTFVAASAAISADGKVNTKLFHPLVVKGLERMLAREPVGGCIELGPFFWELINVPGRETLAQAAEISHLTVVGRVVDREYGFHFDEAGQLLAVEVEEVIRGESPLDHYYYFHPIAEFEAGPFRICKSDDHYPEPPKLGDRVVLMVPRPVHDLREPFLDLVTPEGVVVLAADGEVRVPSRFRQEKAVDQTPSTAASVLELVRRESEGPELQR